MPTLIACLTQRGLPTARLTPRQAREFARALGVLSKTDRVDARVLAEIGRRMPLTLTAPPDPARARPADPLRWRRQLLEMRKAEKLHRHWAGQPTILREIEAIITVLSRRWRISTERSPSSSRPARH